MNPASSPCRRWWVVPVDVLGDGEFEVVDAVPRVSVADEPGLEQRVECLGHRIIVGIADRPDGGDDVDFGETLGTADDDVSQAAIGVVCQLREVVAGVATDPDSHVNASKARSV